VETAVPHVLEVTARFYPDIGGIETHVHEVSLRVNAGGTARATVLATDSTGLLPRDEVVLGVPVERVRAWPRGRDYYLAPGIWSRVRASDVDLVHLQGVHTLVPLVGMLAALTAGKPYVVTFHSGGHSSAARRSIRGLQWRVLGPLLRRADRLIGVSRFEAGHFAEILGLPADLFTVIRNGGNLPPEMPGPTSDAADADGTQPTGHAERSTDPSVSTVSEVSTGSAVSGGSRGSAGPPGGPLVISFGRLEHYKGHHRVVEALPHLLRTHPDARLLILGNGPDRAVLEALAEKVGVAHRVSFDYIPGADRARLRRTVSGAAVVTLLSDYEAQGIAVLEALGLHRPVLVTRTSALTELAEDGLCLGISADAGPVEVAAGLARQVDDPLLPPPDAVLPTWDGCADQVAAVYQDVLNDRVRAWGAQRRTVTWGSERAARPGRAARRVLAAVHRRR